MSHVLAAVLPKLLVLLNVGQCAALLESLGTRIEQHHELVFEGAPMHQIQLIAALLSARESLLQIL